MEDLRMIRSLFFVLFLTEAAGGLLAGGFYGWYLFDRMHFFINGDGMIIGASIGFSLVVLYSYHRSGLRCFLHPEDFDDLYE